MVNTIVHEEKAKGMNEKQREWLASKIADAANLGVAVMLFGWVMAPQKPPFWVPLAAGVLWATFYLIGFLLLRR